MPGSWKRRDRTISSSCSLCSSSSSSSSTSSNGVLVVLINLCFLLCFNRAPVGSFCRRIPEESAIRVPDAQACNSSVTNDRSTAAALYEEDESASKDLMIPTARKSLMVMGSNPMSKCGASKCDGCSPCKAVQVRIQPAASLSSSSSSSIATMECLSDCNQYYPEAWRCKCEGRLYMP